MSRNSWRMKCHENFLHMNCQLLTFKNLSRHQSITSKLNQIISPAFFKFYDKFLSSSDDGTFYKLIKTKYAT